jgi:hypothetical protein
MTYLEFLRSNLHDLQDYELQRKMWLPPYGKFGFGVDELCSQVIDDSRVGHMLENGELEAAVGSTAAKILRGLEEATAQVDDSMPLEELLDDPRMELIRSLTQKALELLPEE